MKIGRSVEVHDPYDWLPKHGENGVSLRTEGSKLIVAITYDGANGACERDIEFTSVCSFYVQAFPGPSLLDVEGGEATILEGKLVEYPESEAAAAWKQHFSYSRTVRHYCIAFLSENLLLVVLAGEAVPGG